MIASTAWWVAADHRQQPDSAHLPDVVAIATCPRIARLTLGSDSRPATSASMLRPIGHIGSTRPLTPRMRPSSSSAATGSASTSLKAGQHQIADGMSGQRTAPAEAVLDDGGPQPTVRTVRCQGRQRHSQITGGTMSSSLRSRPEEPPSSATVTIAVDVRGQAPRRRQGGIQPVPTAQRDDAHTHSAPDPGAGRAPSALCPAAGRPAPRHRDAAVFTPGAADGHGHVALPLPPVSVDHDVQQVMVGVQELHGAGLAEDVVATSGCCPVCGRSSSTQCGSAGTARPSPCRRPWAARTCSRTTRRSRWCWRRSRRRRPARCSPAGRGPTATTCR